MSIFFQLKCTSKYTQQLSFREKYVAYNELQFQNIISTPVFSQYQIS